MNPFGVSLNPSEEKLFDGPPIIKIGSINVEPNVPERLHDRARDLEVEDASLQSR